MIRLLFALFGLLVVCSAIAQSYMPHPVRPFGPLPPCNGCNVLSVAVAIGAPQPTYADTGTGPIDHYTAYIFDGVGGFDFQQVPAGATSVTFSQIGEAPLASQYTYTVLIQAYDGNNLSLGMCTDAQVTTP